MKKEGHILIVDDNHGIRTALELLLPPHFESVQTLPSPKTLQETLRRNPQIDVVLLDMNFHSGVNTGNEGIFWLAEIKKLRPLVSVILFTAYADISLVVKAIKEGALDFIEKPWDNNKLIITLQNGVTLSRNANKLKNLKELKAEGKSMMFWGKSPAMQELKKIVEKVAPTEANVLILGENGTGKQILAAEIHSLSSRSTEVMVSVDMASLSETLIESELFGHSKGAFTDAKREKAGKFEVASGGTLFLDEIGNIPLNSQAKLLSALQSREVVRVGESVPRGVDIRLITATNAPVAELVSRGEFREDLFYRINTFVVELPPLRERTEDIEELALLFLHKYAKKYSKKCATFSHKALEKMRAHSWSGNIRELQHTVEKAVILCEKTQIEADDLLLTRSTVGGSALKLQKMSLEELEFHAIESAMRDYGGNISDAASKLGITRQTLYNKLKKHNL